MSLIGVLSAGVTIYNAGKSIWDGIHLIRGTHRLDEINNNIRIITKDINLLSRGVLYLHKQELYKSSKSGIFEPARPSIFVPSQAEINSFLNVHRESVDDQLLIITRDEKLPRGFLPEFNSNPDNYLLYKQFYGAGMPPRHYLLDETLVPINFLQNNRQMIGFMKKGYVKDILGIDYKAARIEFAYENVRSNPYTGISMRRMESCYCGSGKRFKHCHGALS